MKKVFVKAMGCMVEATEENRSLLELYGLGNEIGNEDIFTEHSESVIGDGVRIIDRKFKHVSNRDHKHSVGKDS